MTVITAPNPDSNGARTNAWREILAPCTFPLGIALYSSKSFKVQSQDGLPKGITTSLDGTKFFMTGSIEGEVFQYELSTAWDISTASYGGVSFDLSPQESSSADVTFNTSHTKMYVLGRTSDVIYQYNLTTADDITTAVYSGLNLSVAGEMATANSITLDSAGETLYVLDTSNDEVHQYDLSTAEDISTAVYSSLTFLLTTQTVHAQGIEIDEEDSVLYVAGGDTSTFATVWKYTLRTVGSINTAIYTGVALDLTAEGIGASSLVLSSDCSKLYVLDRLSKYIYQYS